MTDLLTGTELAARLGVHISTLWRWEQERIDLRACRIRPRSRKGWSVARLQAAGYLVPQVQAPASAPCVASPDRVLFAG